MTAAGLEAGARPLSEAEAEAHVAAACFRNGPVGAVGLELERTVHDVADPARPVPVTEARAVAAGLEGRLPGAGAITLEPGGQVELSSACAPDLPAVVEAVRADVAVIDRDFAEAGLRFGPLGMDPWRTPVRTLEHPRYAAMERHFDRAGAAGRTMMCSTASLQVCLDAGTEGTGESSAARRWERLHRLAPVLVALFANSPFRAGVPTGWASTRQSVWLATDPSRTAPVPASADPAQEWARYGLDASVLCIPSEGGSWDAPRGLTMRGWLRGEGPRPATRQDLDYHLSTLFPYVRPRGFLEIRVIDAQAGSDWEAVAALTTALVDDERAAEAAADACGPVAALTDPMGAAAHQALAHPVLAEAGRACTEAALDALDRVGADGRTRRLTEAFAERHALRGRCPADERLDHWHRTGDFWDRTYDEENAA